jgi:hypothetical protein
MVKLTEADKAQVIRMLEELDRSKLQQVITNVQAFLMFLRDEAYSLWASVKNSVQRFWDSIADFFS